MGIRLTVTVLACGLGAFVGAYQWISWRGDAQPPSTRHEQVAGVTTVPQPASPARPSRTRPADPLSARFTAGSEPATGFRRLAALSLGRPGEQGAIGCVPGGGGAGGVGAPAQDGRGGHTTDY